MSGDPSIVDSNRQALSRRELIKVLSALGGAVAVSSLLPSRWCPPELSASVLPAHAQSTFTCLPPYILVECLVDNLAWIDGDEGYDLRFSMHAQVENPCPGVPVWYSYTIRFANEEEDTTRYRAGITDNAGMITIHTKRTGVNGAVEVTAQFRIHAPYGESKCDYGVTLPPYPAV